MICFFCFLSVWPFLCADTVSPADVGLEEEAQDDDRGYGVSGVSRFNRVGRWAQPITFLDIHECDTFTVSSLRDLKLNSELSPVINQQI